MTPPLESPGDSSTPAPALNDVLKAIVVSANKDRYDQTFYFLGARFDLKVSGKDTGGAFSLYDTVRYEKNGPMLHTHPDLDEWFWVLDGEFKFQVGDNLYHLKRGDALLAPRNVPHAFVKTCDSIGRLLVMHSPAQSMEEYFFEASRLENPTPEQMKALFVKYNMMPVGPPLDAD